MNVADLRGREHEESVLDLLAQAQVHLDAEVAASRVPAVATEYVEDPSLRSWGVCRESDATGVGLVGVEDPRRRIGRHP